MKEQDLLKLPPILLVLSIPFIFWYINWVDKRDQAEYDKFNRADIVGEIRLLEVLNKGVGLKLANDNIKYIFYPQQDEYLNNNNAFLDIAKSGDSIFKKAYSDTLKLKKSKRIYLYTFIKLGHVSN